ncbi:MAG TPA: hypothetical protein VN976_09725 [Verrucomicrobiae bacterium]|nr:hypothetical protein [Verrucomicrobiae bacterium]
MSRLKPRPTNRRTTSGEMFYQLSWTTLPGLRGLACSKFCATPTAAPDIEHGVAVECASEAERDALLAELQAHFGPLRFLNTAAAFDGVKDYVALRATRRG